MPGLLGNYGSFPRFCTRLEMCQSRQTKDKGKLAGTDSASILSSCDDVILQLQILIEDCVIEFDLSVEAVANLLPIGSGIGH